MGKYGEPWEVREVDGLLAIAKQGGWVMENDDPAQDRAEADRKCACVNACSSLPDPAGEIERLRKIEEAARGVIKAKDGPIIRVYTNAIADLIAACGEGVGGG